MIPQSATSFLRFMENIWNDDPDDLYHTRHKDAYYNAKLVAKRTGSTYIDGKSAKIFTFPDGTRIIISNDGSTCDVTTKPITSRPSRQKPLS